MREKASDKKWLEFSLLPLIIVKGDRRLLGGLWLSVLVGGGTKTLLFL